MTVAAADAVTAIGFFAGAGAARQAKGPPPPTFEGKPIPKGGFIRNPRHARKGNPENAKADLRRLYTAIKQFNAKHGRFPKGKELRDFSKPIVPGGIRLKKQDLENPDWVYADGGRRQANESYVWTFMSRLREDPTFPPRPKAGEKYEWLGCDLYLNIEARVKDDGTATLHHSGVYIVLWSDGRIDEIPHGDLLQVPVKGKQRMWRRSAPGETGLPKNAVRMRDFYPRTVGKITRTYD
jgi:hypothetical protein